MSLDRLPNELVLSTVASQLPHILTAQEFVRLRLVNRQLNDIVLCALFDLNVGTIFYPGEFSRCNTSGYFVFRHWKALLNPHNVNLRREEQKQRMNEKEANRHHIRPCWSVEDEIENETTVISALQKAIPEIMSRVTLLDGQRLESLLSCPGPLKERLTLSDLCLYVICHATICIHGLEHAWNYFNLPIEQDYYITQSNMEPPFLPGHSSDVWRLYAAVYLDDIVTLSAIMEPLQVNPVDRAVWRKRLSTNWKNFVTANSRSYGNQTNPIDRKCTFEEQRWIKMCNSALIIAASLGHTNITSYLMKLEPNLFRNVPRTQLYRTSYRTAMGQAIALEQRQTFKLLLKHKWPLTTSTGFARCNYFNALRIAVENAPIVIEPDSILRQLLDMSSAWKCTYILQQMLHHAASRNSIELGEIVLTEMLHERRELVTIHWTRQDWPYFWHPNYQEYALATAACAGSAEFVRFLLQHANASSEIGDLAKGRAIHTLIFHTSAFKDDHFAILNKICKTTEISTLEVSFLESIFKGDLQLAGIILQHLNLHNKLHPNKHPDNHPGCWGERKLLKLLSYLTEADTVGEVALAIAFQTMKWEIAVRLIDQHNVALQRYFVQTNIVEATYTTSGFTALKDVLAERGMNITLEITGTRDENGEKNDPRCLVTFNPANCKDIIPNAFNITGAGMV